ncbi:DUF1178 family protein [Parasphingorhabdus cellanae]|uniref:DUF1178 family protein n=1 Tax=Parasphingorhabdus cellanae TaxID=2806553 RepID=A0ABX7T662_9SPHN|nr:DUF1178 family protein [Parasphingorhabdus cellanae]QTD57096.1 DUF1178 family protein [Parasphingorhabdus cellanae]
MIVFDLICRDGEHLFEGWFGSSRDYEDQLRAGLIDCPICGSAAIEKAVMAPNVGIKANQRSSAATSSANQMDVSGETENKQPISNATEISPEYSELVGKLAKAQAKILEKSKWVGADFSEQARAIHYGEKDASPIHGTASKDDVAELEEEGVEIMPLPLPVNPPESQN